MLVLFFRIVLLAHAVLKTRKKVNAYRTLDILKTGELKSQRTESVHVLNLVTGKMYVCVMPVRLLLAVLPCLDIIEYPFS